MPDPIHTGNSRNTTPSQPITKIEKNTHITEQTHSVNHSGKISRAESTEDISERALHLSRLDAMLKFADEIESERGSNLEEKGGEIPPWRPKPDKTGI